jgi:hypothetical protein
MLVLCVADMEGMRITLEGATAANLFSTELKMRDPERGKMFKNIIFNRCTKSKPFTTLRQGIVPKWHKKLRLFWPVRSLL